MYFRVAQMLGFCFLEDIFMKNVCKDKFYLKKHSTSIFLLFVTQLDCFLFFLS